MGTCFGYTTPQDLASLPEEASAASLTAISPSCMGKLRLALELQMYSRPHLTKSSLCYHMCRGIQLHTSFAGRLSSCCCCFQLQGRGWSWASWEGWSFRKNPGCKAASAGSLLGHFLHRDALGGRCNRGWLRLLSLLQGCLPRFTSPDWSCASCNLAALKSHRLQLPTSYMQGHMMQQSCLQELGRGAYPAALTAFDSLAFPAKTSIQS